MSNSNFKFEFETAPYFVLFIIVFFTACEDPGITPPTSLQATQLEHIVTDNVTALNSLLGESIKNALQTPDLFLSDFTSEEVTIRSSDCVVVDIQEGESYPVNASLSFDDCPNNEYGGSIDIVCYVPLGEDNENGPDFTLSTDDLSVNQNQMITDGPINFKFLSLSHDKLCYTYELSKGVTTITSNGVSETYFPEGMSGCICITLSEIEAIHTLQDVVKNLGDIQLKIDQAEVCCSNDQGETIMCSCIDTNDDFIHTSIDCGCPYKGILNISNTTGDDAIGNAEDHGVVGHVNNDREDSNDPDVCDCEGKELEQICHLQGEGQALVFIDLVLPCPAAKAHLKNHESDYCGPCEEIIDPCDKEIKTQISFGSDVVGHEQENCDQYISYNEINKGNGRVTLKDIFTLNSCRTGE